MTFLEKLVLVKGTHTVLIPRGDIRLGGMKGSQQDINTPIVQRAISIIVSFRVDTNSLSNEIGTQRSSSLPDYL